MSEDLFSSAAWLRVEKNVGAGKLPIPSPLDGKINNLLKTWMALPEPNRRRATEGVLKEQHYTLTAHSRRMAALAVRERSHELILLGLLSLGVDGWRFEWRDNITIAALHHDAAQRIGVLPDSIFEKAASLLYGKAAEGLRAFLRRSAIDKSIEVMGYMADADDDGFLYTRTW